MHFLVLVAVDVENWKSVDLEVEVIMEKFVSSTNNPKYLGICDWYEVGGLWSQLFLVKDSCTEFSYGEFSSSAKEVEAPKGYQWVCAARKKEIAWEAARELLPELKDRKYPVIPYGFVRDGVWIPMGEGQSLASWGKDVDEWISGLDDNAVLVSVDCHE